MELCTLLSYTYKYTSILVLLLFAGRHSTREPLIDPAPGWTGSSGSHWQANGQTERVNKEMETVPPFQVPSLRKKHPGPIGLGWLWSGWETSSWVPAPTAQLRLSVAASFVCQRRTWPVNLSLILCLSVLLWGSNYSLHSVRLNAWKYLGTNKAQNLSVAQNDVKSTSKDTTVDSWFQIKHACSDASAMITRLTWHLHLLKSRFQQKRVWMCSSAMLAPMEWRLDGRDGGADSLCISHLQQHIRCDMAAVILWEPVRLLHFIS